MSMVSKDMLQEALEILKILLQGEEVGKNKNVHLYELYRGSAELEDLLRYVAGQLELKVYWGRDKLFVCPEVGSRLFGWSNEELRSRIPYVNKNDELYLGYFIIMTFITLFYKEAYPDTHRAYVKVSDLIESMGKRFDTLFTMDDLEKVSVDNQFNFVEVCRVWRGLADAREGVNTGKLDKVNFVKNICSFLEGEGLVVFDRQQGSLYPKDRFKTIIWQYYEDRDNRNDLLSFVSSLEG